MTQCSCTYNVLEETGRKRDPAQKKEEKEKKTWMKKKKKREYVCVMSCCVSVGYQAKILFFVVSS
jgi:hypothetical protein